MLVHSKCSNFLLSLASHGYSANVICQNENTLLFKNSITAWSEKLSRYVNLSKHICPGTKIEQSPPGQTHQWPSNPANTPFLYHISQPQLPPITHSFSFPSLLPPPLSHTFSLPSLTFILPAPFSSFSFLSLWI